MKNYTIYNPDGKILSSGLCQDELYGYGLEPGQLIAEFKSDPLAQYIKNDTLIDIPAKPDTNFDFDYQTESWISNPNAQWESVTLQRNSLLAASDWTQLPDVPLTTKQAWADYRQALRDITMQTDPFNIVWPTKPE